MPEDKTLIQRLADEPELIAELSAEELGEAKGSLIEAIQAFVAGIKEKTSDDPKADMEAAAEAKELLASVEARITELSEAEAEVLAEAEKLLEGLEPEEEDEEEPDSEDEPEVEAETEETPEVSEEEPEEEEVKEKVLVADSKPSIRQLAKRTPKPETKPSLVASAGPAVHSEYPNGFSTPAQLGEAAAKAWNAYGRSKVDAKALVASFDTGSRYKYQVNGDPDHDGAVIDELMAEVRKEARTNPGTAALVASGGICAPSQPLYDFFSIVEETGMIALPTVGAPRGRITYPVSPSYADVIGTALWDAAVANEHTNAEDESGTSKPNFSVVCPTTTTCTVAAYSTILGFGNFANRFYPEFVANSISLSASVAAHKVNAALIADMVAAATAQGAGDTGGGGLVNVANLIGFEAAKYRDTFRMAQTARLELIAPTYVHDALVADLVARNATTSFENARGRVSAVFESLNLNVQFVQDWQSIGDNNDGGFPPAADFLLYAPGTFVRLDEGRLDLGIVRDSTLNATNDFQTFTESFEAVCEVGHDAWLLDDVTVCPRGIAAADATLDCNPGFNS